MAASAVSAASAPSVVSFASLSEAFVWSHLHSIRRMMHETGPVTELLAPFASSLDRTPGVGPRFAEIGGFHWINVDLLEGMRS